MNDVSAASFYLRDPGIPIPQADACDRFVFDALIVFRNLLSIGAPAEAV